MAEHDDQHEPELFDPHELSRQVVAKRRGQHMTLRQVAEETGVSVPTLSRVERGGHLPERENMLRLARWVGMRLDPVALRRQRNRLVHRPDAETIEAIELHLRADRNLEGDDAEALADMFRIAYERLRVRPGKGQEP